MNIAIIGAGNVGTALATSMTNAGHQVVISAADPEHARAAAQKSGARAAVDNASAARDADVIVLAVPFVAAGEAVAADIAPVVEGKVVIDATNPLTVDYQGLATGTISGAETFQQQLPKAKVVKAFNSLFASHLAQPDRQPGRFHRRRRRRCDGHGHFARPVARLPPGLRRPSELRALPGGHGLPQHHPQRRQRLELGLGLEARAVVRRAGARRAPGGRATDASWPSWPTCGMGR